MAKFYTPTKISENIRETPEGYLLCLAVPICRTGWQDYAEGEIPLDAKDGKIRVHRALADVTRPETIASFQAKAVTIKHPAEFVTPDTHSFLAKGSAQNVRVGDELDEDGETCLLSDLLITDAFAIQLVKAGLREVSCGYEAEYEQTGEGEGKQTNIVGNHIALVEEGRAGASYAINDHKGKVTMSKKLGEKIKALLGKTIDEAMEEKKDENKAKDEAGKKEEKKEEKSEDAAAYDELVEMADALMAKISGMKKSGDEKKEDASSEEKSEDDEKSEEKSEDDDGQAELMARIDALEAAVAKLMEGKDASSEEESESEDSESEEKGEEKKKHLSGDSAAKKKTGLEGTKNAKSFDSFDNKTEIMTADKLNELNAAHWARK